MQRVVHLAVVDWDSEEAKRSGVRTILTPFPAEPVEEFINWIRENKQWRNDPQVLADRCHRFLKKQDQLGPLAPDGSVRAIVEPRMGPDVVVPVVQGRAVKTHIPCPHCDKSFGQVMHLGRHLKAKHPEQVAQPAGSEDAA